MKKIFVKRIGLTIFLVFFVSPASDNYVAAGDNGLDSNPIYELQGRCHSNAEHFFKIIYNDIKETTGVSLKSHYNVGLNKCLVILNIENNTEYGYLSVKEIFNFTDSYLLGTFKRDKYNNTMFSCYVLDKICSSEAGWDTLVKPYMEE